MFEEQILRRITLFASLCLYAVSLSQECYCTENGCHGDWSGLAILISGALGFFLSPAGFTWFANFALLISWCLINKSSKKSLWAALIATGLAFSFLLFDKIVADEAGNYSKIVGYRVGYWLWCTSTVIMVIGNILALVVNKRKSIY